ncbi:MAG: DUF222 domain-containing protein, partial [Gammaproteobacteria bacterium]|nr:DUF222 domain-containing protein [Gammaproteobacteria bacterium]
WRDVSQATFRFLVLLREFDLRQGWKDWGSADCADWLNLRCGITRNTAQEKVRVARALWTLPQIEEAFKRGDLSYSKVRALTRVACEINETDLLDYALGATASQLEGYCRRLRNGGAESTADARRVHAVRSLSRYFREDGSGVLSVELAREELELVLKALEQVATGLPDMHDCEEQSLFTRGADALVQMARESLGGRQNHGAGGTGKSSADHTQVVIHVDAAALLFDSSKRSEGRHGGTSDLPIETVRRLCCDGSVIPVNTDAQGEPLNVGRKQRTVPTAIRRALIARDRTCTFPGCSHERWIDAHHIKHWADGGETSLDNTILLCSHHHRLVHEGGFTVATRCDGSRYFARPDGRPVEVGVSYSNTRDNTRGIGDEQGSAVREPIALYLVTSPFDFPRKVSG